MTTENLCAHDERSQATTTPPETMPTSEDAVAPWRGWQVLAMVGIGTAISVYLAMLAAHPATYLLFHALVELFSIVVAVAIFSIGWNTRAFTRQPFFIVLAVAFLFVGLVDLLHTLAFYGMGVFPPPYNDKNPATQLWVAARYLESLSFVLAAVFLAARRAVRPTWLMTGYFAVTAAIIATIFLWRIFPDALLSSGLTPFKITSEYLIAGLFLAASIIFWASRRQLDRAILIAILTALALKVFSEIAFTNYGTNTTGLFNALGHFLKLYATCAVYQAFVIGTLVTPYRSLFRDVEASRRHLQDALHTSERLQAQQQTLLHMVSHDLRSPLAVIKGYSELLGSTLGDSDENSLIHQGLDAIHRSANHMNAMIGDLVDVTRWEGGQLELQRRSIDLPEFIGELLQRSGMSIETARISVELPPDLPPVWADDDRLERILTNLLSNALKYSSSESPVTLSARAQAGEVEVSIADLGKGIAPQELPYLFERFYRSSRTGTSAGIGLGLYITRVLVETHGVPVDGRTAGGRIWVESEVGCGSTFHFTLPTVPAH